MKLRVTNFPDFELDTVKGTLRNIKTGNYLPKKLPKNKKKYVNVTLRNDDGEYLRIALHKLMLLETTPNPDNKPTVHHLNHNRQDNRLSNLVWATYGEQHDEEWEDNQAELKERQAKAIELTKGSESLRFNSIAEAGRYFNKSTGNLVSTLKGRQGSFLGYNARYVED